MLKTTLVAAATTTDMDSFAAAELAITIYIGVVGLDVFAIVMGFLIVLLGRILSEASKISNENRSFYVRTLWNGISAIAAKAGDQELKPT